MHCNQPATSIKTVVTLYITNGNIQLAIGFTNHIQFAENLNATCKFPSSNILMKVFNSVCAGACACVHILQILTAVPFIRIVSGTVLTSITPQPPVNAGSIVTLPFIGLAHCTRQKALGQILPHHTHQSTRKRHFPDVTGALCSFIFSAASPGIRGSGHKAQH
jgi:hypothetical protein